MGTKKGAAAGIKFGTPPPRRQSPYDWTKIADTLRKHPGTSEDPNSGWALVFEGDRTTLVTAIRNGGIAALRKEKGFEVRTANNTTGSPRTCDLWLRYVPENDTEKEKV